MAKSPTIEVDRNAISCIAHSYERVECAADTSQGVILVELLGPQECLLGNNWGYDENGIWVRNGCGGKFLVGEVAMTWSDSAVHDAVLEAYSNPVSPSIPTWGVLDPGEGALIGRSPYGEVGISAYLLIRFIDQMPGDQTFTDHLGRERPVDTRLDFQPHRVMVFLKGWLGDPKFIYQVLWWTVNATDQDALLGNIGYQFCDQISLYGGFFGNPGTRSLQGSHPYWLGHDRVMADEFFRPFFTWGVWAIGEPVPGLWYNVSMGNNSSNLSIKAVDLDRKLTYGGSVWWMPTTKEFGERGSFTDWEYHEELATRFGISTVYSPEEAHKDANGNLVNTTLRLADSVNLFEFGALAEEVTISNADYRILSLDAGMKYKGFFLQTEIYHRWLDDFRADGVLPVSEIRDKGFYIQSAFFPIPKKWEVYAATSQIYGDEHAGFSRSYEYILGTNYYLYNSRNYRINFQVIDVHRSPVSSSFGYYVGGQDGTTVSLGISALF